MPKLDELVSLCVYIVVMENCKARHGPLVEPSGLIRDKYMVEPLGYTKPIKKTKKRIYETHKGVQLSIQYINVTEYY